MFDTGNPSTHVQAGQDIAIKPPDEFGWLWMTLVSGMTRNEKSVAMVKMKKITQSQNAIS